MRIFCLFILTVLVSAIAMAEQYSPPELDATLAEQVFHGFNCDPTGGPSDYEIRLLVNNPYEAAMSLNYSYYDTQGSQMVDGGRACVIPPFGSQYCSAVLHIRLGGIGNGTITIPATFTGSILNSRVETPTRTFNLTLTHLATSSEQNVEGIISSAEAQLLSRTLALASACDGGACCGMRSSKESLDTAGYLLSGARSNLATCDFSGALSASSSASALIRQAQASYDEGMPACTAALDLHKLARGNISAANSTLYSRAACGVIVNESRVDFAVAVLQYNQAAELLAADSYPAAEALLNQSIAASQVSLAKSAECPGTGFEPQTIQTPSQPAAPTGQPQSDTLSKVIGALGYIVIAAIIIVVAAALYITLGKKWVEGGKGEAPREDYGMPPPGTAQPGESVGIDHSKIDKEFEDWLRQTESHPQEKPAHKPKKKGAS